MTPRTERFMRYGLAILTLLAGCAGSPAPTTDAASSAATSAKPPADAKLETFAGVLTYVKIDTGRKTPEAYKYESLILTLDSGEKRVLRPTDAFAEEAIRAFDGKRIQVSAVWDEGVLPDPRSQHLIQLDGTPVRRGSGWRVWALSE